MPRIKEKRFCIKCGSEFFRHNGNINAKYCSRLCACRMRNTADHQRKAGRAGAKHKVLLRGTGKGYIKEFGRHQHRVVAEKKIGRQLRTGEVVHHIDGNKKNNSPQNLLITTQSEHVKIHARNR